MSLVNLLAHFLCHLCVYGRVVFHAVSKRDGKSRGAVKLPPTMLKQIGEVSSSFIHRDFCVVVSFPLFNSIPPATLIVVDVAPATAYLRYRASECYTTQSTIKINHNCADINVLTDGRIVTTMITLKV